MICSEFRYNKFRVVELCFIIEDCFSGIQRRGLLEDYTKRLKDVESADQIKLSDVYYSVQYLLDIVTITIHYQEALVHITSRSSKYNIEIANIINRQRRPDEFEKLYPTFKFAYANNMYP